MTRRRERNVHTSMRTFSRLVVRFQSKEEGQSLDAGPEEDEDVDDDEKGCMNFLVKNLTDGTDEEEVLFA